MNNHYRAVFHAILGGFQYCADHFWNKKYVDELKVNINNVMITENMLAYDEGADYIINSFITFAFDALEEMRKLYEERYEFAYEETGLGAPTDIDPFDIPEIQDLYNSFIQELKDEEAKYIYN